MKNKGAIIAIFAFAAIGLTIFLLKDKIANWFKPTPTADTAGNGNASDKTTETIIKYVKDPLSDIPPISELDKDKVLKKGSKGNEVKQLQAMINQFLKVLKKTPIVVDGAFGTKSETALYFLIQKKQTTLSQFATLMIDKLKKGK